MNIQKPQGAITDFNTLGLGLLTLFILVAGLLSFFYIMLAGFKLITAGGNKDRAQEAGRQIIHSLVGLIIVLSAWGLMNYFQYATGACFGLGCNLDLLMIFNPYNSILLLYLTVISIYTIIKSMNFARLLNCLSIGLISLLLFLSIPYSAHAQTGGFPDKSAACFAAALDKARGWDCPLPPGTTCAVGGDVNKEGYLADSTRDNMFGLTKEIAGVGSTNCPDKIAGFMGGSALGMTTSFITAMYQNPPASTTYYAYDLLHNAGFIESAYAQGGIGYSGLTPILPVWKALRNFSYIIVVIMLMATGFMIMFRMHINPQTVISIQTALPNVIVTLLMITFSYAIAGLLIDLMYFIMLIVIQIYGQIDGLSQADLLQYQTAFLNAGAGTLFSWTVGSWENITALPFAIGETFFGQIVAGGIGAGAIGTFAYFTLPWALPLSLIVGALPLLVMAVILFAGFMRLLAVFVTAYIQLLIQIVFAPIILLYGIIPGRSTTGTWIRSIIGNLIVFPAAALILLFVFTISAQINDASAQRMWAPPFIFGPSASANGFVALINIGVLLLMPSLLSALKKMFISSAIIPITPSVFTGPIGSMVGKGASLLPLQQQITGQSLAQLAQRNKSATGEEPPQSPGGAVGQAGAEALNQLNR